MKKILIIYASAGDGHKKAAEAVYNAFSELKRTDMEVVLIDSLNYTTRFFKYAYKVGYMFLIKYIPHLWGFFYYILDIRFFYALCRPFRRAANAFHAKRLSGFLIKEKFDIAISTHFLAPEVISRLKKRGLLSLPLINIITDFKPHLFWQVEGVDYYVVAAETTKQMLKRRGVPEEKIKPLGMPVRKRFNIAITKEEARKRLRLYPDKFTILVMGGGFGVGPIEKIVLRLQWLDFDCQIITICGHNKRLFSRLDGLRTRFKKPTRILGFCINVDEIMSASDIMISKVGGMAVSEALIKSLPTLTVNPIPGQEMRNASFLFENNIGIRIRRIDSINKVIQKLYHDPGRIRQIRHDMADLARPYAAEDITRLGVSMIEAEK